MCFPSVDIPEAPAPTPTPIVPEVNTSADKIRLNPKSVARKARKTSRTASLLPLGGISSRITLGGTR